MYYLEIYFKIIFANLGLKGQEDQDGTFAGESLFHMMRKLHPGNLNYMVA